MMKEPHMRIGRLGFAALAWLAVAACGDDGGRTNEQPSAGASGSPVAGSGAMGGTIVAGSDGGGSGVAGSAGAAGAGMAGSSAASGGVGGTAVQVGVPDAGDVLIGRPEYPSPVLAQTGQGCAIKSDGTMWCWDNTLVYSNTNIIPGEFDAVYMSSDSVGNHLCGHFPSGGYSCYSLNSPIIPAAGREYVQLAIGSVRPFIRGLACGLLPNGKVECWGIPGVTNTPTGTFVQIDACEGVFCGVHPDGTGECWDEGNDDWHRFPVGERFKQVSAGRLSTCGVTLDARALCWGVTPIVSALTDPVRMISVDGDHACALLEDGHVECFGDFVGLPYEGPPPDIRFRAIDAGLRTDCGITTEQHVWCWGPGLPPREMLDADGQPIVVLSQ